MTVFRVTNVSFGYGPNRVLKDVCCEGSAGEVVGLVGPNGAGKTTLANVVSGILRPSAGVVELRGENVVGLPLTEIARRGLSRLFQGQHLPWNLTARECLAAAVRADRDGFLAESSKRRRRYTQGERRERIDSLIEQFELEGVKDNPAHTLSFGQQRLLGLAMASSRRTSVLLLDEPFLGLKSSAVDIVARAIRRAAKEGAFVIVIDHMLSAVQNVSCRLWFMYRGVLESFASYRELTAARAFRVHYMGGEPGPSSEGDCGVATSRASRGRPTTGEVLSLEDVSAGYGNRRIFARATVKVHPGEVVAVIGANGSGKSTLLRAIAGTARVMGGTICLGGRSIVALKPQDRVRLGMRVLTQDHRLFRTLSIAENVELAVAGAEGYSLTRTHRSGAEATAVTLRGALGVGAREFARRRAVTYSGGEQARVAIAIVGLGCPKLVLLDEPTSGIDGQARSALLMQLRVWQDAGVPVLMVEHALDFVAEVASRVLLLKDGELSAIEPSGTDAALNAGVLLSQLLG